MNRGKSSAIQPQDLVENGRRTFLRGLGVAAATTAVAGTGALHPAVAEASAPQTQASGSGRAQRSFLIRNMAAGQELQVPTPAEINNGDERRYPNFIGNFSKGLPHNSIGEVDTDAYQTYLAAIQSPTSANFESVPLGGTVKLVNPLAGVAFDLEGTDSHQLAIPPAPAVAGQARADEMVELYWMALCRDVNFTDYASSPLAQAAAAELSSLSGFGGPRIGGNVTAQTLFRGFTADNVIGPYVSQLFQTPFSYGQYGLSGQVTTYQPDIDYLTTQAEWLACQNGQGPFVTNQIDPQTRHYRNGRDLAVYVHVDHICEAFYNAALRLYESGAPANPGNPYVSLTKQAPFGTFGEPHFLAMNGEMAVPALKAVWYSKWFVHRALRPEAYGGLVHMNKTGQAKYPLHPDVLGSKALQQTFAKYGTYLLSSAFPEGCPQHPSYAQGHGSVSGACATILKAAFDGSVQMNTLQNGGIVVSSEDGLSLVPYTGADANQMTVNGEINKVASNIGLARNFANVHWRSDYIQGLKLGEAVAISILRDESGVYGENFSGFQIKKFDGTTITI